eukprot:g19055.t1
MTGTLGATAEEGNGSTLRRDAAGTLEGTLKENFGASFQDHTMLKATTNPGLGGLSEPEVVPSEDAKVALRRCRELLRTDFGANEDLWLPPAEGLEGEASEPKLQAEEDPQGGGLFLSHVWDEPFAWAEHFQQSFASAKALQVSTALQEAERRHLHEEGAAARERAPRPSLSMPKLRRHTMGFQFEQVWVDFASLPPPVSPSDHPLEQTIFGPYRLPVEELKRFVPRENGREPSKATLAKKGYTLMHLPEGHHFTGSMRKTEWDDHGRPLREPELEEVSWSIPAGWHFIRNCRVIPEGFMSPSDAAEKPQYRCAGIHSPG